MSNHLRTMRTLQDLAGMLRCDNRVALQSLVDALDKQLATQGFGDCVAVLTVSVEQYNDYEIEVTDKHGNTYFLPRVILEGRGSWEHNTTQGQVRRKGQEHLS